MNPFLSVPVNSWSPSPTSTQGPTIPALSPAIQQPQPQLHAQGPTIMCPECAQELIPNTSICWRCLHNLYSPNPFANPTNLHTAPTRPQPLVQPIPPVGLTPPLSVQQAQSQLLLIQQILQNREQSQFNLQQYQAQQQQIPALPSQPSFVVQGTTASNPITISDSPTLQKQSLPLLPPPALMKPLPGAWPMTGVQQPQRLLQQQLINLQNAARQNMDLNNGPQLPPVSRLFPPRYVDYGHHYGNPSADEIKELLANIRPDEEIKTEDKDAIVPGLARNMRLMKHQQARRPFIAMVNDRWG